MGPKLPRKPAKHQRTDPPAENREQVQRATGVGMSHQGQRAQRTPGQQSGRRDGATPCQNPHCEIRGADVDGLAQSQQRGPPRAREARMPLR